MGAKICMFVGGGEGAEKYPLLLEKGVRCLHDGKGDGYAGALGYVWGCLHEVFTLGVFTLGVFTLGVLAWEGDAACVRGCRITGE
ncbi:hypothetical protein [Bartonella harrusi]|uniref:Uncharacterized protein n=1 Tax=Bartonella harrusi TaxID=2961895 RepID=A0ABY5ETI1_9HYPH|nr:hypothetical protein [Bartonella harrusi]UTO28161.1 hypothetical protein NMK50_08280 [Bartonella harrusi]